MLPLLQSSDAVVLHLASLSLATLTFSGTAFPSHCVLLDVAIMIAVEAFLKVVNAFSFFLSNFFTQPSILFTCLSRFWYLMNVLNNSVEMQLLVCLLICFRLFLILKAHISFTHLTH